MAEAMQSSLTTLRVLEIVGRHQPVAVSEVAQLIDRPKSTTQRALTTLHEAGWIRPGASDRTRWVLTTRITDLARCVGNDRGLRDVAAPVLRQLRESTCESVGLYVLDADRAVLVDFYEGTNTLRIVTPIGVRVPLHTGSAGRVILAHLDPAERARLLAAPLPRYTDRTITSPVELEAELARIRAGAPARSYGEFSADVAGTAAVVRDPSGRPVASIAVNLPATRSSDEVLRALDRAVQHAATDIEHALHDHG
jgi:IclR family transcriptional regulator, acetate operon repressor